MFLGKGMADQHDSICTNLTVIYAEPKFGGLFLSGSLTHIPNCSHWVQQDVPGHVTSIYISEFLTGK